MEHFTPDRTAAGRRYDRTLGKLLPSSRLLSVLFCLLLNSLVYWCTQSMVAGRQLLDLTTSIDQMIPFDPRWVFIYVACFLFWAVGYVLMARLDRWYSIMTAEVLAKLICGIVFLLIPCTNVRPEIAGTGPAQWLLGLIYRLDPPLDLLPSIPSAQYSGMVPDLFLCFCDPCLSLHAVYPSACAGRCDHRCCAG